MKLVKASSKLSIVLVVVLLMSNVMTPDFGRISNNSIFTATKTVNAKTKRYKKLKIKAKIEMHDSRIGSFMVSVKNLSYKTVTIIRDTNEDWVCHGDYTKYDRDLRLDKKKVKIKPGKTKYLWYDVIGSGTKAGKKKYTLYGTLKYKGRRYTYCVDKKYTFTWKA